MVATMTCKASLINFGKTKPVPSTHVPLHQPLGYARPQSATFATSGALAYGSELIASTVRKASAKLDKADPEDAFSSLFGKKEKQSGPTFKSALEQVSYETNGFLNEEADKHARRQGMIGRVTRMFRK